MKQKVVNICLMLFLAPLLSGCIATALASAVGGGAYYMGKAVSGREDRKIQTESLIKAKADLEKKQEALSSQDKGITNEVNGRLISGSVAPNMAVYPEVKNGVVILHGRVPDPKTAERVITTVRSTPGVKRIISNLVVVDQQQQAPQGYSPQQQQMMQQRQGLTRVPPQQRQYSPRQYKPQQYAPPQSNNRTIPNISDTARKNSSGAKKKSTNSNVSKRSKRPANTARTMSEKMMEKYQDNDATYVKYQPSYITPPSRQQLAPVVSNPYIVNVPTPTAYTDNDSAYTPYTGYHAPVAASYSGGGNLPIPSSSQDNDSAYTPYTGYHAPVAASYDSDGNLNVGIPTPSSSQDNDSTYELMYYY